MEQYKNLHLCINNCGLWKVPNNGDYCSKCRNTNGLNPEANSMRRDDRRIQAAQIERDFVEYDDSVQLAQIERDFVEYAERRLQRQRECDEIRRVHWRSKSFAQHKREMEREFKKKGTINCTKESMDELLADLDLKVVENKKKNKTNRCDICRKKIGLTPIICRCNRMFCGSHRYSDAHNCDFDYIAMGAREIAKQNPKIVAEKIRKF